VFDMAENQAKIHITVFMPNTLTETISFWNLGVMDQMNGTTRFHGIQEAGGDIHAGFVGDFLIRARDQAVEEVFGALSYVLSGFG